MEEEKTITKSNLIEIFKTWPVPEFESLEQVIDSWNDPEFPGECADYIWQRLNELATEK